MKDIRIKEVPDEVHLKFKLLCVKKKITMNQYFITLMEKAVEKEEKKNA